MIAEAVLPRGRALVESKIVPVLLRQLNIMIELFLRLLFQRSQTPLRISSFANDESDHQISFAADASYLLRQIA